MFTHIKLTRGERHTGSCSRPRATFHFWAQRRQSRMQDPDGGARWRPTVQPIALEWWTRTLRPRMPAIALDGAWTTVMNWASYKPEEFEGESYGQKDVEFMHFAELPSRTREKFVLAMGQGPGKKSPDAHTSNRSAGKSSSRTTNLPDYASYHDFLSHSKAEWSIAKNGYVKSRSGWFSCRSACYLAAGKPVVVQDTGWSDHLAIGRRGALLFHHCRGRRAQSKRSARQTMLTTAQPLAHYAEGRISTARSLCGASRVSRAIFRFGIDLGRARFDIESGFQRADPGPCPGNPRAGNFP